MSRGSQHSAAKRRKEKERQAKQAAKRERRHFLEQASGEDEVVAARGAVAPAALTVMVPFTSASGIDGIHDATRTVCSRPSAGIVTSTRSPRPESPLRKLTEPPCNSAIRLTIDSPSPLPVAVASAAR